MNNQRNFVRGSEATSSVRLRRRKDANSSEGTKKRNRHSGDFFVWSAPGSNNNNKNNNGNRLSQDWSYMVPQAPSSLMVASTTSRKNYGLVDDPSPLSMPYSPVVAAAIAAHRQQQRSSSNGRIDEEDGFMETLDRRIPPSVRPIARDNSRFLETSSDFITSKSRLLSGNRRSCDVSQFHVEDYQGRAEPVKKRPLSVVGSGTFLPNNSNINNYNNNKLQNNSNKFGLSSKGKKLAKSTDHLIKRSYPELREAVSEVGALDTMFETTTNVSTVVAQQSNVSLNVGTTICKGLMWQQRDKIFSRWKERFFILTQDYLQCFKKGSSRMTEMGGFIFKLKLSDVNEVELLDKKGYLTVSLVLNKEGKILLRKPEGIREWFATLKECVQQSKERKGLMKSTKEFWSKRQFTDSNSMEQFADKHQGRAGGRRFNHHRSHVGLYSPEKQTTDYGFIDAPPPKSMSEVNVKLATSTDALNLNNKPQAKNYHMSQSEAPLPYSSGSEVHSKHLNHRTNTRDSSSSHKSQDSGIDSIEKQHGHLNGKHSANQICSTSTSSASTTPGSDSQSSGIGGEGVPNVVSRNNRNNLDLDSTKRQSEYLNEVVDKFPQLWLKRDRSSCDVGSRLHESAYPSIQDRKPNRNSMLVSNEQDYYYQLQSRRQTNSKMSLNPTTNGQALRPQVTKL